MSNKTAKHHQSASRKALPLGTAFASVAGLLAAAAVDGNPLVFTPDEYAVGNAGQSDQYVDVQLPDGTVVRLPAGQYVISPEGLLVPLVNGTDDFDGDGLADAQEDANGNGNWFDDDSDGDFVPDFLDSLTPPSDTNADGISDALEDVDGDASVLNDDTDGDNIPNYADPEKLVPASSYASLADYVLPAVADAGFSWGNYWTLGTLSFAAGSTSLLVVNAITLPRFDAQAPTYVSEGSDVGVGPDETTGATVGAVLDIDAYAPGSGVADAGIAYAIEGGNLNGAFAIDEAGLITIANPYVIDFETTTTYYLSVRATDSAGRSNTITVEVNVEDAADTTPTGPGIVPSTITEDDIVPQTSINLGPILAGQKWELSTAALNAGYSLDASGSLSLGTIDLENLPSGLTSSGGGTSASGSATLTLPITATSLTGETTTDNYPVIVNGDVDEDPYYIGPAPTLSLPENEAGSPTPYAVGSVAGTFDDGEYTPSATISYTMAGPAGFSIATDGSITYFDSLGVGYDYETSTGSVSLTVTADDGDQTTDKIFWVSISDEVPAVDDGAPTSVPTQSSPESVNVDTTTHWSTIFDLAMTEGTNDNDDAGITYSITSGMNSDGAKFGITDDGEIYLECLPDTDPPNGSLYPYEVVVEGLETGGDATITQSVWIDLE